ncbi:DUF72 domain-containing protein [Candidatus Bipolaricaulota bacterium]
MTAELRIGTSGYSFPHWVGTVYPEGTRQPDMLKTYAKDFDAVEVNFTYYRNPSSEIFEGMLRKVDSEFEFVVKAPKGMTHERDEIESVAKSFVQSLKPLIDSGQLGGVIVQFPQSFHANDDSFDHLKKVADAFVPEGIKTSVEFRHKGWYRDDVYELLQKLQLGFVNVDLPRISALPAPSNIMTNDVAYYRFHGRNAAMWYNAPTGSHRYDYMYSDAELDEWSERIEKSVEVAWKVFVFANNCHKGSSFISALRLKQEFDQYVRSQAEAEPSLFASTDPAERIIELRKRVEASRAGESP